MEIIFLASIYIIDSWFDPPSDITTIPQSYTVHCVIVGGELDEFHYYYKDSSDIDLTSTYCSSQTGYYCSLATDNTVITDVSPDPVIDKTITVRWEAEEISSGAFRQDNGDHVIKCYARRTKTMRESIITVKGECVMLQWNLTLLADICHYGHCWAHNDINQIVTMYNTIIINCLMYAWLYIFIWVPLYYCMSYIGSTPIRRD